MRDPLSDIIELLRPRIVFTKAISGAGAWAVRYPEYGQPSFCTVLEGTCLLSVDGQDLLTLQAGDFVLLPATPGFVLSGTEAATPKLADPQLAATITGEVRHGKADGPADVRLLGGYFVFESPDADLLVSLLPPAIHLRDAGRLSTLVRYIDEETKEPMAGRDLVLSRLVEVLLVEALRRAQQQGAPASLLRGLGDARVAQVLREMHGEIARPWTVAELASRAALSRSAFFERFARVVGVSPMEYLLDWRMAVAKDLLRRQYSITDVADRIGYGSASAFSTAFARQVGNSPARFAREAAMTGASEPAE